MVETIINKVNQIIAGSRDKITAMENDRNILVEKITRDNSMRVVYDKATKKFTISGTFVEFEA
ncbi:hypothetical protein [Saccharicrinis sp. GN24d3]|uniref:hypothetical protein n=1 Tax=Saccharicrinis sp. GN24d3 TaxID=3458416 RepID=UPI0040375863